MGCRFVFALAAVFCCGAIQASAQHSSVPREGKAGEQTATHGIIRTPQARAIDSAKAGEAASSARPATPAQCPRKLSRLPSPRLCVPLRKPGSPCPLPRRLEPFSRGRHERHSADTPFAGRPSGSRCSGKHRTNGSRCPGTPPARPPKRETIRDWNPDRTRHQPFTYEHFSATCPSRTRKTSTPLT